MTPLVRNNVTVAGNTTAARTIIFVNGLGTNQSYWSRLTPAFADDHRLVLFDNVGTDASSHRHFLDNQLRYLDVKGYAGDLLEICAALELDASTVLVGHSLGAVAGMLAAVERPGQFSRLVLFGASPRYTNAEGYHGGFSKEDINAIYRAAGDNYTEWSRAMASAAIGSPDRALLARQFAESIARIPRDMMLTILCSVLQTDHRADLGRLRCPTLLVQSQDDYFVPMSVARYMHAQIPDSRLAVIDASGHLPHLTDPDKLVAAIEGFVRAG